MKKSHFAALVLGTDRAQDIDGFSEGNAVVDVRSASTEAERRPQTRIRPAGGPNTSF